MITKPFINTIFEVGDEIEFWYYLNIGEGDSMTGTVVKDQGNMLQVKTRTGSTRYVSKRRVLSIIK